MATPDVSVVIPTFNRRAMTRGAIGSVMAQQDVSCELIVADDGSTDGTAEEVEALAETVNRDREFPGIKLIRMENRGPAAARNAGVAIAASPMVAFLDSDDLWASTKLRRQFDFMRARKNRISQTEEIWIRSGIRVNPGVRHRKRSGDFFLESLRTCLISPSAVMMDVALFRQADGFDEDFRAAEDYDLWLRIMADNNEVELLPDPLVTRHSGHLGQLSATVPAIDRFRILALLKLLVREDLSPPRRKAVRDVLAEKSRIYATGLERRGRAHDARFVLAIASMAWDSDRDRLAWAALAMRDFLRRSAMGSSQ